MGRHVDTVVPDSARALLHTTRVTCSGSITCARNPFAAEHVKAVAHVLNMAGAAVQAVLLRASETPVYANYWTMSACIYAAFFSLSGVRLSPISVVVFSAALLSFNTPQIGAVRGIRAPRTEEHLTNWGDWRDGAMPARSLGNCAQTSAEALSKRHVQIRRDTAKDVHWLAMLASCFVGIQHRWQGDAARVVALDMMLSCAVILIVQPTLAILSEARALRLCPVATNSLVVQRRPVSRIDCHGAEARVQLPTALSLVGQLRVFLTHR